MGITKQASFPAQLMSERLLAIVLLALVLFAPRGVEAQALAPLGDFLAGARRHNLDNREAAFSAAQRGAEATQARWRLLPIVGATAGYTFNQYEAGVPVQIGSSRQTLTITPQHQVDATVSLTLPLVDVGNWLRIGAADASLQGAHLRAESTMLAVERRVTQAYYQLVAAEAVVLSAGRALEVAQANQEQLSRRLEAGLSSPLERDRAAAEVARDRQVVAGAELQRALAAHTLESLTGLPAQGRAAPLAPSLEVPAPLETWRAGLSSHPSVRAAQSEQLAAERAETVGRMALLPTLNATAQERLTNATGFAGQNAYFAAGVSLSWRMDLSAVPAVRALAASAGAARVRADRAAQNAEDDLFEAWQRVRSALVCAEAARAGAGERRRVSPRTRALRARHRHPARRAPGGPRCLQRGGIAHPGRRGPGARASRPAQRGRAARGGASWRCAMSPRPRAALRRRGLLDAWLALARVGIAMALHDKVKSLGTLVGVLFAVLLSTQQAGTLLGLLNKNTMFVDRAGADLWIAPAGTVTLQAGPTMSDSVLYRARVTPGVRVAEPLLYAGASVALPGGGTEAVTLVGARAPYVLGGPWNVVAGSAQDLARPDTLLFEDSERRKLGGLNLGSVREVSGRRVVVGGFTWGLLPFGPSYAFADYDTARLLAHVDARRAHFVLATVEPGRNADVVAAELRRRIPDARVFTRAELHSAVVRYLLLETPIGMTFGSSALFGLLVGLVIVSLSMFSAVVDNLREFGTLKAIGATTSDLARVLLVQAVLFASCGTVLGLTLITRVGEATRSPKLGLSLPWQLLLSAAILMQILCISASLLALWRIRKIEPAMVFR